MSEVKFAAFNFDGQWRLEQTRENVFSWLKTRNNELPKHLRFDRIYRLRSDRDLHEAKDKLHVVMINRYKVEPVRPW